MLDGFPGNGLRPRALATCLAAFPGKSRDVNERQESIGMPTVHQEQKFCSVRKGNNSSRTMFGRYSICDLMEMVEFLSLKGRSACLKEIHERYVSPRIPHQILRSQGQTQAGTFLVTNKVITSKYTIITFLPRNLLEQFCRVANYSRLA